MEILLTVLLVLFIINVIAWIGSLFYIKKSIFPMLILTLSMNFINLAYQIAVI